MSAPGVDGAGDPGVVTVAIPVLNGGALLAEVLASVHAQSTDRELEVLVADSGSTDGSVGIAEAHGARVIRLERGEFAHGRTRNLLLAEARGSHVALLTQDAVPAAPDWLAALLGCFELADDVALVFGPYLPRSDASHMVRRELTEFFAALAPDGRPRFDRVPSGGRAEGPGPLTYFTDANACLLRAAWARVPFRDVPYAEDQMLAVDMLEAGYAKVFCPGAPVVHSHDYPSAMWLRRCFDEWRGLREVHGHVEPSSPRRMTRVLRGQLHGDWAYLRQSGVPLPGRVAGILRSLRHYAIRAVGAALGSRADRLSPPMRRRLSLERRASFEPRETNDGNT